MSKINTGGFFHPTPFVECPNRGLRPVTDWENCGGVTVRDWLATHATEEDIRAHRVTKVERWQDHRGNEQSSSSFTNTREQARYAYADAMIATRGEGTP